MTINAGLLRAATYLLAATLTAAAVYVPSLAFLFYPLAAGTAGWATRHPADKIEALTWAGMARSAMEAFNALVEKVGRNAGKRSVLNPEGQPTAEPPIAPQALR